MYIQWDISQLQKGSKPDTHYIMNKHWKHHAKWRKPDTKGQMLWLHLYMVPRIGKYTDRTEVTREWGKGEMDCLE